MPKALPLIDVTAVVCCAPVSRGPMDPQDALEVALRLKALADPTRLRILSLILADPTGEGVCTCDLAVEVDLTEATVSHHLGQLRGAGLVEGTRRGMNVFYTPLPSALRALARVLDPEVATTAADA